MGIKRVIDTELWTDEKVESFTPEEKLFWVYLLTNPFTRQLGIYRITKKQIAFQLGYDVDTISKLIDRFQNEYKLIKYENGEIAILNFLKRSILKGGKPVEDCLMADIKNVKNKDLISWVFAHLENEDVNDTVWKVMERFKKERTKERINDNDNDNDSIVATIRGRIVNDGTIPIYDCSKNVYMSKEEEMELLNTMKGRA